MSWLDDYTEASFRGTKFWMESSEGSFGRRTTTHEYPQQDMPTVEDNGRAPRRFRMECWVIGPDYKVQRDKVIAEFEAEGSGDLVHPWYGTLTVTVEGQISVSEGLRPGGSARISVTVVQTKGDLKQSQAGEKPDTKQAVENAADNAQKKEKENYHVQTNEEVFAKMQAEIQSAVNGVVSKVNAVKGAINQAMGVVDEVQRAVDEVADVIEDIMNLPDTIADKVQGAVASIQASVSGVASTFTDKFMGGSFLGNLVDPVTGNLIDFAIATAEEIVAAIEARDAVLGTADDRKIDIVMASYRDMVTYDLPSGQLTTPSRILQAQHLTALARLFATAATIETCRAVANLEFSSWTKAQDVKQELTDQIDTLAEASDCDDACWSALNDLRAALIDHIDATSADLPTIISFTPGTSLPVLLLAHSLYGDATREAEIVARNSSISNPCAVQGGIALEVLTNG
jgi:prophage DNA circulation protein